MSDKLYIFLQQGNQLLVKVNQGLRTGALSSVGLEVLTLHSRHSNKSTYSRTKRRIIKVDGRKLGAILAKVREEQITHGFHPTFTAVFNHIVNGLRRGIRTDDCDLSGSLGIEADTDTEHSGVHEEFKRLGEILVDVLRRDKGAVVEGCSEVLLVDLQHETIR